MTSAAARAIVGRFHQTDNSRISVWGVGFLLLLYFRLREGARTDTAGLGVVFVEA